MKLEDMNIYKDAIELARVFRQFFKEMPNSDQFSVGQQMLRSSVSIASNIAEGVGRGTSPKALLVYLGYSKGSLYEFKAQLEIISLDYKTSPFYEKLSSLITSLEDGMFRFTTHIEKKL